MYLLVFQINKIKTIHNYNFSVILNLHNIKQSSYSNQSVDATVRPSSYYGSAHKF